MVSWQTRWAWQNIGRDPGHAHGTGRLRRHYSSCHAEVLCASMGSGDGEQYSRTSSPSFPVLNRCNEDDDDDDDGGMLMIMMMITMIMATTNNAAAASPDGDDYGMRVLQYPETSPEKEFANFSWHSTGSIWLSEHGPARS